MHPLRASAVLPASSPGQRAPRRAARTQRQKPEENASRALYERHKERVFLVCLRQTGNASDALDASQETFIRVFANLSRFRGRSLSSWIHVIAVNASRDLLRKGDRRERCSLDAMERRDFRRTEPHSQDEDGSPELALARHELEAAVERALSRLSASLREVVLLRYVEGLPYEHVAGALHVPIGTVKSRLSRAHAALERSLEPKLAAHGLG